MCNLLSFSVDRKGKIYVLLDEKRKEALYKNENPDSHSYIAEIFGIDDDNVWKYEIPFTEEDLEILKNASADVFLEKLEYDGGLSEEDLPASVLSAIQRWIRENFETLKRNIYSQLMGISTLEKFKTVLDNKDTGVYVFKFATEISREKLIRIIQNKGFILSNSGKFYFRPTETKEKHILYNRVIDGADSIIVNIYSRKTIFKDEMVTEVRWVIMGPIKKEYTD